MIEGQIIPLFIHLNYKFLAVNFVMIPCLLVECLSLKEKVQINLMKVRNSQVWVFKQQSLV